jgi:hypothetical protein
MRRLAAILLWITGVTCLASGSALAALYEPNPANWGTLLPNSSDCDDCFDGPIAFSGVGQSLNFFGGTYSDLYVGSNGYVTFGAGATDYSPSPLNVQIVGKMIAGLFTDLDSRSDANSNVYVNTSTPGQIVVTYQQLGHFDQNYSVRSTFQIVIRSDQFVVPPGEGRIGFFYASITDADTAAAGFGDGLAAVNPGEVAFYNGPANGLSNSQPRWYNLSGGIPVVQSAEPIPTLSEWAMIALFGMLAFASMVMLRRQAG